MAAPPLTRQGSALAVEQRQKLLSGWLKKKSPKGFFGNKPWQDRFFSLYEDLLYYFKAEPTTTNPDQFDPSGSIPIQLIAKCQLEPSKNPAGCRFSIHLKERVFELQAKSPEDAQTWSAKVNEALQRLKNSGGSGAQLELQGGDKKIWKDTMKIRQARARSSQIFGSKRYLVGDPNATDTEAEDSDEEKAVDEAQGSLKVISEVKGDSFGMLSVVREDAGSLFFLHAYRKNRGNLQEAQALFEAMSGLKHRYLFQQVCRDETSDAIFAVYTHPIEQSLYSQLKNYRFLPQHVVSTLTAQLVSVLDYLHQQQRTARNLCTENVFLDGRGNAILTDFYLALPTELLPKGVLIPEYRTPEYVQSKTDSASSDWWRLGVLVYELMVGLPPFVADEDSADAVEKLILAHDPQNIIFPPWVDADGQDFVRNLLQSKAADRLGNDIAQLRGHAFFKDVNWDLVEKGHVRPSDWVEEALQGQPSYGSGVDPTKEYSVDVTVKAARNLPGLKAGGASDPYCAVSCASAGDDIMQSDVVENTITPEWNFNAQFELRSGIKGDLKVAVHHREGPVKFAVIGTVSVQLSSVEREGTWEKWFPVVGGDGMSHGEVLLSLKMNHKVERSPLKLKPSPNSMDYLAYFCGKTESDLLHADDIFSGL